MPLYEEKFISPFAIRFSQWRIRPTFQDGRVVEESTEEIEALPAPRGCDGYEVLLKAPFPPIEIIRWRPKLRDEDGTKLLDEDGTSILGEPCWFTFDNRRLYCLQAAAVKQWPCHVAAIVHVMHDLPLSKCAPKKFQTTDLGCSVRISRRFDLVPQAVWNWTQAVSATGVPAEALQATLACILEDAVKEEWSELQDVPANLELLPRPACPLQLAGLVPKKDRGRDLSSLGPAVAAVRMAAAAAAASAASSNQPARTTAARSTDRPANAQVPAQSPGHLVLGSIMSAKMPGKDTLPLGSILAGSAPILLGLNDLLPPTAVPSSSSSESSVRMGVTSNAASWTSGSWPSISAVASVTEGEQEVTEEIAPPLGLGINWSAPVLPKASKQLGLGVFAAAEAQDEDSDDNCQQQ